MKTFYLPLVLTVGGGLLYHIGIKSVSTSVNPFVALLVSTVILVATYTICGFTLSTSRPSLEMLRASGWSVLAIGVGAASIELGFLWAYGQGWEVSRAGLTTSVLVALLLAMAGLIFFKEGLSGMKLIGILFCVVGLILVTRAK